MRNTMETHITHTTRAGALTELYQGLITTAAGIAQRIEDRRALNALRGFDDHQLKDIGVTRADVEGEITKRRFW